MSVTLDTCIDCTNNTIPTEALYRDVVVCDADGNRYVRVYNEAPVTIDQVAIFGLQEDPVELSTINANAAWDDWGPLIDNTEGYNTLTAFIKITHTDSVNNRFRIVGVIGGDYYPLPLKTIASSVVTVLPHYYEIDSDTTQNIVLSWEIDSTFPAVQIQCQAGTVGVTADVYEGWYTLGYR